MLKKRLIESTAILKAVSILTEKRSGFNDEVKALEKQIELNEETLDQILSDEKILLLENLIDNLLWLREKVETYEVNANEHILTSSKRIASLQKELERRFTE